MKYLFIQYIFLSILIFYANIKKITPLITLLLNLNKLKINLLILSLLILTLIYTLNYQKIISLAYVFIFSWKYKFYFFIKTFLFGFFKSHLILFYIMSIVSILRWTNFLIQIKFTNNLNLLLLILSFSLGAQWALYLFNWGFYWTNDSIEVILILFIWVLIYIMHKWSVTTLFVFISNFFNIFLLITLRSNLIFTKHNFFKQSGVSVLLYSYIYLNLFIFKIFSFCSICIRKKIVKFNYLFFSIHIYYVLLIFLNILNYWYIKKLCILFFQLSVLLVFIKFINFDNIKIYFIHFFFILFLLIFNLYTVIYFFVYYHPNQSIYNQKLDVLKNIYSAKHQFIQSYFQFKINKTLNSFYFSNKNHFFFKKLITNFYI